MFGERFRLGRGQRPQWDGAWSRGPGRWGNDWAPRPRAGRGLNIDRLFENRDADDDGKLTEQELQAAGKKNHPQFLERIFDEADADEDGALTAEELQAWKEKTMDQRSRPWW